MTNVILDVLFTHVTIIKYTYLLTYYSHQFLHHQHYHHHHYHHHYYDQAGLASAGWGKDALCLCEGELLQMVRRDFLFSFLSLFLKYFKRWEDKILLVFFFKLLQMKTVDFVLKLLYENPKTFMEARNVPRGSPHVWINSIRLISITKENGNKKRIVNQAKSGWNGIKVRSWIPKLLSERSRLKRLFSLGDTDQCVAVIDFCVKLLGYSLLIITLWTIIEWRLRHHHYWIDYF